MVLKRKLPTQESKLNKKSEKKVEDNFDLALESDAKESSSKDNGHDIDNSFPDQIEDKPEDFIPEELRAMEQAANAASEEHFEAVDNKESNENLKQEQEHEDIAPVSFDDKNDSVDVENNDFDMNLEDDSPAAADFDSEPDNRFISEDVEPAELPGETIFNDNTSKTEDDFTAAEEVVETKIETETEFKTLEEDVAPQPALDVKDAEDDDFATIEFDNDDTANWSEVANNSSNYSDDSFETIAWNDDKEKDSGLEERAAKLGEELKDIDDVFDNDNGGIVPEIPGMDFSQTTETPASVLGDNTKEMNMSSSGKVKIVVGFIAAAAAVGGVMMFTGNDENSNGEGGGSNSPWSKTVAENEDADSEDNSTENNDITELTDNDTPKSNSIIDFSDESSDSNAKDEINDLENELSDEETEINLLEPKVVEKTSSGKELIKATGEEEIPEDVEEGANLISNITAELERQKAIKQGKKAKADEESNDSEDNADSGNAADINKKVDEQLAEYRKLLAAEEDPGKKVKPGKFFEGNYKEPSSVAAVSKTNTTNSPARAANIRKVALNGKNDDGIPDEYALTSQQVEGHQIVEYPNGVARRPDEGIRQLDHFRNLLVEKEDKRVRIPKGIQPGLRNQGFPTFKVISIVPNYGLFGEYSDKKGVLIIGDSFKGWELVGVYDEYAEFKKENRKHIISLK